MELYNRAMCSKCKEEIISTRGGEFVKCSCGESFIDTDRWDCTRVRLGGSAEWKPTGKTYLMWVILKQFAIAHHNFYKADIKDKWFELECTQEQEDEFREWFTQALIGNKKMLKAMYDVASTTKKTIKKIVDNWILNYGFTIKQTKDA